jgi:hypothetical protein
MTEISFSKSFESSSSSAKGLNSEKILIDKRLFNKLVNFMKNITITNFELNEDIVEKEEIAIQTELHDEIDYNQIIERLRFENESHIQTIIGLNNSNKKLNEDVKNIYPDRKAKF